MMILTEIKNFLLSKKQASLLELTQYFKLSADTILPMLEIWIKKGKLTKTLRTSKCGVACNKCSVPQIEIFQWVG